MWICLNNAFLSIVTCPDKPRSLLVRARFKGDLERVFPAAEVTETRDRDYRYRAVIGRMKVAAVIGASIASIDYGNFKDSVEEDWRHSLYLDLWLRCVAVQEARTPRARARVDSWPAVSEPYGGFDSYPADDTPYDPAPSGTWGRDGQSIVEFLRGKPVRGNGKRSRLSRKGA
jgi:hypothetical protein